MAQAGATIATRIIVPIAAAAGMAVAGLITTAAAWLGHKLFEENDDKLKALNLEKRLDKIEGKDPNKSIRELRKDAAKILKIDTVNNVNIGFCGSVNTGKSSLINALRGIKRDHPNWAPVGPMEKTTVIKEYPVPGYKRLVFWDIPGSDVPNSERRTYFYKQLLYIFDFLVVMSRGALSETELLIAEKARECGVPFAIVRSHCDEDLRNKKRDEGKPIDLGMKTEYVATVRRSYMNNLSLEFGDHVQEVFCVSSVALEQFNADKQCEKYLLEETRLMDYIQNQIRSQRAYQ